MRESSTGYDQSSLSTLKLREITVTWEHGDLIVSRSPRQRWIDMCWQLLGMQLDAAQCRYVAVADC